MSDENDDDSGTVILILSENKNVNGDVDPWSDYGCDANDGGFGVVQASETVNANVRQNEIGVRLMHE